MCWPRKFDSILYEAPFLLHMSTVKVAVKTSKKKKKSKTRTVQGSGSYVGDWFSKNKSLIPRALGGLAGSLVGQPQKGWDIGADVSKNLLGWGRYRVRGAGSYGVPWNVDSNTLTSAGNIPKVVNVADAGVRISHTEYLGTVTSSASFKNTVYYINPGLVATFPWLSKIAVNFQQWKIHGCLVVFKSQMTDAVATFTALGSVAIAANMNPAERACANQVEMEQLKFCAVSKPSEDIVAPIECARGSTSVNSYFVRTSAVPSNASQMDYDHGTIQVASGSSPSDGVVLGRLYLSYDISLLNPRMVMTSVGQASYNFEAFSTSNYLGTLSTMNKLVDTIGLSFTSPNSTVIFPRGIYGSYLVELGWTGAQTALSVAISFTYVNCALTSTFKQYCDTFGTRTASWTSGLATTAKTCYQLVVEITDTTQIATITVAAGTVPGTPTGGFLNVLALSSVIPGQAPLGAGSVSISPSIPSVDDDEKYEEVIPAPASSAQRRKAVP